MNPFCCFWPISRYVILLAAFDALVVGYLAWTALGYVAKDIDHMHWSVCALFVWFATFAVCQAASAVFVWLAEKQHRPKFVIPRFALVAALTVCSLIVCGLLAYFFMSKRADADKFVMDIYEKFYDMTDYEKGQMSYEIRLYALGLAALAILYLSYNVAQLWLLTKYWNKLHEFRPVSQTEPSAPPIHLMK